jgi:predicted anti-sigma-YlaC factor YlaD
MNAARHPSDLALETYLMERESSKVAPHVGGCDTCRGRIAQMEREGQDFLQYVFPATVEKVEEVASRGARPAWMRWVYIVPLPVVGLAAALFVALSPVQNMTGPGEDYIGTKGAAGTLGLTVFLGAVEGARPLAEG